MKIRYCHAEFEPGLTCVNYVKGKCVGGRLVDCEHQSVTPKCSFTVPMPPVKPPKSMDCEPCIHEDVKDEAMCPLTQFNPCLKNKCAWWCEWTKSCAMVAIPAEISDRASDIMKTIGG